jgi:hypothetical protein
MNAAKGTWTNGQVVPAGPVDWPEGCQLLIEPATPGGAPIGLTEADWRDDPATLADWDAWLTTIEPLDLTPQEEAEFRRFDDAMRTYNLDAVRRKMAEGPSG